MKNKTLLNVVGVLCLVGSLIGRFVLPEIGIGYTILNGAGIGLIVYANFMDKNK